MEENIKKVKRTKSSKNLEKEGIIEKNEIKILKIFNFFFQRLSQHISVT